MTTDPADHQNSISLTPVAYIRSCYTERFGIPRQAGLVHSATATIVFDPSQNSRLSLRGLDEFSHLWIVFVFHKQHYKNTKPLVNPPRLGGKKRVGVFATRSPNRPNPVGLSAVQLDSIEETATELQLHIRGGDFLDGTPVLDIKPYVPFADSISHASAAWADDSEPPLPVRWRNDAHKSLLALQGSATTTHNSLQQLIEETIAQDPRPAYERTKDGSPGQSWGMKITNVNVRWQVVGGVADILQLDQIDD